MDIFKGLFRNFFRSSQPGRNYEDKTPYKVQVMNKALTGMNVGCAGGVYRLLVPKRLYKKYVEAQDRADKHKELTPMEKLVFMVILILNIMLLLILVNVNNYE